MSPCSQCRGGGALLHCLPLGGFGVYRAIRMEHEKGDKALVWLWGEPAGQPSLRHRLPCVISANHFLTLGTGKLLQLGDEGCESCSALLSSGRR